MLARHLRIIMKHGARSGWCGSKLFSWYVSLTSSGLYLGLEGDEAKSLVEKTGIENAKYLATLVAWTNSGSSTFLTLNLVPI
jgi:hypothetical protein